MRRSEYMADNGRTVFARGVIAVKVRPSQSPNISDKLLRVSALVFFRHFVAECVDTIFEISLRDAEQ